MDGPFTRLKPLLGTASLRDADKWGPRGVAKPRSAEQRFQSRDRGHPACAELVLDRVAGGQHGLESLLELWHA